MEIAYYGQNFFKAKNQVLHTQPFSFQETPQKTDYFGLRYGRAMKSDWWVGLDFSHRQLKARAPLASIQSLQNGSDLSKVNMLSAIATRQFQNQSPFTPYLGAGLGVAVPNLDDEVSDDIFANLAYEYAAPSGTAFAGVDFAVDKGWSIFSEVKMDYQLIENATSDRFSVQTLNTDYHDPSYSVNIGVRLEF